MSNRIRHWSKDNAFVDVCIKSDNAIGVALANDEMVADRTPFSFLAVKRDSDWLEGGSTNWDCITLIEAKQPLSQLLLIGVEGQVHITGSGDRHTEEIIDNEFSPKNYGLIRGARNIDGEVFVCGMKKQVYKRNNAYSWSCISKQIIGGEGVHGFEAIDGFSKSDIYAVGWQGEIWHFDGENWNKKTINAENILLDVCCAGNGKVNIIGRGQIFIYGKDENWKIKQTDFELINLCWFKNNLYASSTQHIFKLNENENFEIVEILGDSPETCGKLSTNGEIMISAGERDLFSFDGENWKRLD
jgi:hypothetical protein